MKNNKILNCSIVVCPVEPKKKNQYWLERFEKLEGETIYRREKVYLIELDLSNYHDEDDLEARKLIINDVFKKIIEFNHFPGFQDEKVDNILIWQRRRKEHKLVARNKLISLPPDELIDVLNNTGSIIDSKSIPYSPEKLTPEERLAYIYDEFIR